MPGVRRLLACVHACVRGCSLGCLLCARLGLGWGCGCSLAGRSVSRLVSLLACLLGLFPLGVGRARSLSVSALSLLSRLVDGWLVGQLTGFTGGRGATKQQQQQQRRRATEGTMKCSPQTRGECRMCLGRQASLLLLGGVDACLWGLLTRSGDPHSRCQLAR